MFMMLEHWDGEGGDRSDDSTGELDMTPLQLLLGVTGPRTRQNSFLLSMLVFVFTFVDIVNDIMNISVMYPAGVLTMARVPHTSVDSVITLTPSTGATSQLTPSEPSSGSGSCTKCLGQLTQSWRFDQIIENVSETLKCVLLIIL